jgi:hypothetical protein
VCCLLVILGIFGPRFVFLLEWIFGHQVQLAFHDGFFAPLLGLVFAPWTALFYVLAYAPVGGVSGIGWVVVALGAFFDLMTYTSGGYRGRRRAMA